jgi:hypothetical protein
MVNVVTGHGPLPKLVTVVLLIVVVSAALAAASGALSRDETSRDSGDDMRLAQDVDPDANSKYARREKLPPRLRESLALLGNRLTRPCKERLTLEGTLSFGNIGGVPFRLIGELPNHLRLEAQADRGKQIFTFDGQHAGKGGNAVNPSDEDVIETFAFDSLENLFTGLGRGASIRQLAFHSQTGDGEGYAGPFYDVYEITSDVRAGKDVRRQAKLLLVNSDTLLPEAVTYERERDGAVLKVEVRFNDWREVGGQMLPFRVVRTEDGNPSITMEVNSADSGPETQDGAFNSVGQ